MRKVMLVDDEYMLLRGLKLLIDWESLGLEIVNTEQNPSLALKYLQDNDIDMVDCKFNPNFWTNLSASPDTVFASRVF
ncbi:DNA-binding response regulator AraC family [Lactiplantibacillus plantarum]|nr:DNA-binding response regulator AraC family [Lactiplantibacillus plantarum]